MIEQAPHIVVAALPLLALLLSAAVCCVAKLDQARRQP